MHTYINVHNKGPRSIDEPNEESSCFSAYLLNSISSTRSACFTHPSVHSFIYPHIVLSVYLFFYLFTQLSIRMPGPSVSQCLHLSFYLSINHYTGKQRCGPDRYSLELTRLVLVMHSRFICFPGTNTSPEHEESNKMAAMVWKNRFYMCVCLRAGVERWVCMLKIGLWRAVAKWIMLQQIFILLGYCPVFGSIKEFAFRSVIRHKAVILVGKQRKGTLTLTFY